MPDARATALQHCPLCGLKLSRARLGALLRRRVLRQIVEAGIESQADAIARLAMLGFAADKVIVSKDLKLLGAQRRVDARWTIAHNPKE